jgi:hypothetical protein
MAKRKKMCFYSKWEKSIPQYDRAAFELYFDVGKQRELKTMCIRCDDKKGQS